jgi:hypothetical protein
MRIRIESPFSISFGLFKPARVRHVAALGTVVHWYEINHRDLDTFLREIFQYYNSNYDARNVGRDEYVWYASLTVYYYRGTTVALNLSKARLYHNPTYRLQFRIELSGELGFYPNSIEFWELDTRDFACEFSDVRSILNKIVREFAQ